MNIEDLYPNLEGLYSYDPIIDSFGDTIIRVDDNDSGDSYVFFRTKDKLGILIFGWGSCSFSDALLNCKSYEDVQNVYDNLQSSIKWFENVEEVKAYLSSEDLELEWYYYEVAYIDFVEKILNWIDGLTLRLNKIE